MLHVKQHPSSAALANYYVAADGQELPADRVAMTFDELRAWKTEQIANGWTPVYPPDPPPTQDQLAAIAAEEALALQTKQAKAAYSALMDGTGTQLERLVRCERVLARVLREVFTP